jgi:hypothetical protein
MEDQANEHYCSTDGMSSHFFLDWLAYVMAPNYMDTNSLELQAYSDVARVVSPQG